jgi:rubrerythrin
MRGDNLKILIEKAIEKEEESYNFYIKQYNIVTDKKTKNTLVYLAEQEKIHKNFLIGYIDGIYTMNSLKMHEIIDYSIAQYLDDPEPKENMQSKDVYLAAANCELNLYNFYIKLAEIQPYGIVKKTLVQMAEEELKHKERVEYLYSNSLFPQTEVREYN